MANGELADKLSQYNKWKLDTKQNLSKGDWWSSAGDIGGEIGKSLFTIGKSTKPTRIQNEHIIEGAEKVGAEIEPSFFQSTGLKEIDPDAEFYSKKTNKVYNASELGVISQLNKKTPESMLYTMKIKKGFGVPEGGDVNDIFGETVEDMFIDNAKEIEKSILEEKLDTDVKTYKAGDKKSKRKLAVKAFSISKDPKLNTFFKKVLKRDENIEKIDELIAKYDNGEISEKKFKALFEIHRSKETDLNNEINKFISSEGDPVGDWKGMFKSISVEEIWDKYLSKEFGEWGSLTIKEKNELLNR